MGWDFGAATKAVEVEKLSVPETVETQAGMTAGSIVAGGVIFRVGAVVAEVARNVDVGAELTGRRRRPKDSWKAGPLAGDEGAKKP